MLSKNELELLSRFTGLSLFQQEKVYLITIILKSIFSKFHPTFKGGTALSLGYGLNRFSDDLDFTAESSIALELLQKIIINDLRLMGINSKIDKIKEYPMGISLRIGAQGPLFEREIQRNFIEIDISYREQLILPAINYTLEPIYTDLLPFSIKLMDKAEIATEKIRAILTRNRARDIFDLDFLIRHNVSFNVDQINSKLAFYDKEWDFQEFSTNLSNKENLWDTELKSIIIGQLPNFESVKENVLNFLEKI